MIKFTVPGNPMAWQRARQHGKFHFETPEQTSYKSLIVLAARQSLKKADFLIQGPIALKIRFFFKRPQARCRKSDSAGPIQMFKRPDADNCIKMIGDAGNGVLWKDDAQICNIQVDKFYHEIGGKPRTEIEIEEI